jgi:1-acyl-sn-glycerol-3-phosphate acyltransferase
MPGFEEPSLDDRTTDQLGGGPSRRAAGNGASSRASGRVPPRLGWLQQVGKRWTGWAFRWFCRLRVEGAEHVPRRGPVIIAANHRSMLDVPLVVVACPRPIAFMAHRNLFGDPVRAAFFHAMGGYPVDPHAGRDTGALGFGTAVLERGLVLGLFPEGTRSRSPSMGPFLPGAAWLALRTGVPVVPCGIVGTEPPPGDGATRWLRRRRIRISFGPPIVAAPAEGRATGRGRVEALTGEIRSAVETLTTDAGRSSFGSDSPTLSS